MKDKKLTKYIILIVLLFVALVYIETNKKEPVSWEPTFINTDKNPYGTYICYDLLKEVFPTGAIKESRFPITNELKYVESNGYSNRKQFEQVKQPFYKNTSYIFINHTFGNNFDYTQKEGVDKLDIKNLLSFVEEGNNAFITGERISSILLDSLKLKIEREWSSPDSIYTFTGLDQKEYALRGVKGGQFFIVKRDSCDLTMRTLVESKKEKRAIFVKIKYGEGFIYLHSMPVVFSNVNLLKSNKYDFAFKCLSYLPKTDNIIWDEYLKQGRVGEHSSFRVIWNHPALLVSYFIVIFGGLLFVLFRSKRTQRIIPVVEPPKNTSLEFLDTISNLYYQKQAYESIIDKRHSYFLDVVRTRYYLRTETIDDEFMNNLHLKSGVALDVIKSIFESRNYISHLYHVDNNALLRYNEKLEQFYREMK